MPFVPEGYVDLDYDATGKLVIERVKQVRDPEAMGEKAVRLIRDGKVATVDGGELELEVESICVHGDAPNARRSPARSGRARGGRRRARASGRVEHRAHRVRIGA